VSEKATKPKNHPLWAEPLEERLPVSSSAARVLFGLGLFQDSSTADATTVPNSVNIASYFVNNCIVQSSHVSMTYALVNSSAPVGVSLSGGIGNPYDNAVSSHRGVAATKRLETGGWRLEVFNQPLLQPTGSSTLNFDVDK